MEEELKALLDRDRIRQCIVALARGEDRRDGPMIAGQRYCHGPTATLDAQGIEILVVTHPGQMLDQQQFRAFGIQPDRKRVVALKSQQHFRAAFAPLAGRIVVADGGGLSTADLSRFPFTRVRRPIYPLDPDMTFEPKFD